MSTTVLPQLREIESELAAQEESLSAQLKEVQDRLNGVRAVLPMFGESGEVDATSSKSDSSKSDSSKSDSSRPTASATSTKTATATKAKAETSEDAGEAKQKKTKSKKKDGRAADWQKYTRPGVKNQSIPDAVKLILATQPEKEFKIAEVMSALFKDGMPKAQYLKARNRVSNVLSGGVRAGDWSRGARSTYRMGE